MPEFNPERYITNKEKVKRKNRRLDKGYVSARLGGKTKEQVAEEMDVTVPSIMKWLYDRQVPPYRAIRWCQVTGEKIEDVAPNLFPPHEVDVIREYLNRVYKSELLFIPV